MSKPTHHAHRSARKYGGTWEEYLEIHEFLDQTKAGHADMRHRALLHNSMGPFIAIQVFGRTFTNSAGKVVDVRQVLEDHILEDLGRIPSVSEICEMIPLEYAERLSPQKGKHSVRTIKD
jgi:hypothetical protein